MFLKLVLFVICWIEALSHSMPQDNESVPRGCAWWRESERPFYKLVCRLKNVSIATNILSNLSVTQAESIQSLGMECNETLLNDGQLDYTNWVTADVINVNVLKTLPRLKILRVEHCKIKNLPNNAFSSTRDLQILILKSHNDKRSSITLDIHEDALRGLSELRELDLGDNNIWTLPSKLLCPSPNLLTLNLTNNRIQDTGSLGFADWATVCVRSLETLDLSHNDLSVLSDYDLSGLRSLTTLNLQDNSITAMADKSLDGLTNLRHLNLSSNKLVALPPELFVKSYELRELVLSNNSLSMLAPGLLYGLRNLSFLDLSRNNLTSQWTNRDTFKHLSNLRLLDLSYNVLTKIDTHVFRGLTELQLLNLEHNEIDTLIDGCFNSLANLRSLALSYNKLVQFKAPHAHGLSLLHQFFIDDNRLQWIHPDAFENLTILQDLRMSGNLFTEVPKAVTKLSDLKTLDLGNNKIRIIDERSFAGLDKLSGLRLVDNKLENITRHAFNSLPSLQILNLASNNIKYIEQNAFIRNSLLIALRLDSNQLTEIQGIFDTLPSLLMLNISDNKVLWFDYGYLPKSLEWLDMHANQIRKLSDDYESIDVLKIKKLDASFNFIMEISESNIPNSIEKLYLNNNQIQNIAPGTFMRKTELKKVFFNKNFIQHIDIAAIEIQPISSNREPPIFYIGENPIRCDCTMEWLPRINELSKERQYPRFLDLNAITCTMMHARAAPHRPLLSLRPKDFLCEYKTHCFAICHCCDFDACDCKMTCPHNCSCYHDHSWSNNVVDCSNAGYTLVPDRIPMDATEIYLDANDLGELGSHLFIGKRKLEILYLNNSGITNIHNRTFNGVESLKVLHLESNTLTELKGFEFDQLHGMTELYLDHNAIVSVANNTFRKMNNLDVLKLNDNRIIDFKPWDVVSNNQANVYMEGNAWNCNCTTTTRLQSWLTEHRGNSVDRMYCIDNGETIAQALKRCNDPSTEAVHRGVPNAEAPPPVVDDFVPMLIGVIGTVIAIGLFGTVGFVFRQHIRMWPCTWCRLHLDKAVTHPEEGSDKLYDGYLVYNERDEDFVSRYVAAELEQTGLTLCLHWRDLSTTRCQESLPQAVNTARRIIIVFSPLFLNNEWQHPEFKESLKSALENIHLESRRKCVIVILAVEVPSADLELQLLLQTCTIIVWGEKRFWENLRSVMPDSNKMSKRDHKLDHQHIHHPESISIPTKYSAAPSIVMDAWICKPALSPLQTSHPVASVHGTLHALTPTPTQSTYVSSASSRTEEEDSGYEHHLRQQQHLQQLQRQSIYSSLHSNPRPPSVASRTSHLYSTIPELTIQENVETYGNCQVPITPRTYFV